MLSAADAVAREPLQRRILATIVSALYKEIYTEQDQREPDADHVAVLRAQLEIVLAKYHALEPCDLRRSERFSPAFRVHRAEALADETIQANSVPLSAGGCPGSR